jgi:metal-responsive CopG/Arc/MetJ family transcriptional regulator
MKTIAVSIDEPTLEAVDRIARGGEKTNRSRVIREALGEFLERRERALREERERRVFSRHRNRLARQASALVAEQEKGR